MRFDHLMHWVPDLDAAVVQCAARGFPLRPGGRIGEHLHNAFWAARTGQYVELMSVLDLGAWRAGPRGTLAASRDAAMATGGGVLQFALEVEDLPTVVAGVRSRGVAIGDPVVGSIRYADGCTGCWRAAWVSKGPGWRPFFIQYGAEPGTGGASEAIAPRWAAVAASSGNAKPPQEDWTFQEIGLEAPDPAAAAGWLARVLGANELSPEPIVTAGGCAARFVEGPRDRIFQAVLAGNDGPVGDFFGVRYERTPAPFASSCSPR